MIPIDKLLHFLVGFCIASTLAVAPIAAIVCAVLAGAAKEGYDYIASRYLKIPHEVSSLDFMATVAGGLAGTGLPYIAAYFFTNFPQLVVGVI